MPSCSALLAVQCPPLLSVCLLFNDTGYPPLSFLILEVEFIWRSSVHEQLSVAAFKVSFKSVSLTRFQVVPPCSALLTVHCPPLLSVCLLFNTGHPLLSVSTFDFTFLNIYSICLAYGRPPWSLSVDVKFYKIT